LDRWENEGREDILYWCELGDLWVHYDENDDGKEAFRCPFLRKLPRKKKYKCLIYETRPDVCRGYPYTEEQVVRDRCKGFAHVKKN
jgi:Fe-S-cluster containining protein